MEPVIALAADLIKIPSITPQDLQCQDILIERLKRLGFTITQLPFAQTSNFWAYYGKPNPSLVFAGHTDVVPIGDINAWDYPPFDPSIHNDCLYGRGAADMKGSLAAMVVATERFLHTHKTFDGGIGFLITSAEEGPSFEGTPIVLDYLKNHNINLDYCIVGEPTSSQTLGDTIKNGRRGTLTGALKVIGKQGHIAYPHLADNPIHPALSVLASLVNIQWDSGNKDFQPTSFQISNINAGTGAGNVIPGTLDALFNLRYSPEITAEQIKETIHTYLDNAQLNYELEWTHFGTPYHTVDDEFLKLCQSAINDVTGVEAQLSTSGGTSDARYIAKYCNKLIEFGPSNATIHQVNEHVRVDELIKLTEIYLLMMEKILK